MKNKFNWQRKYITNTIFSDSIPRLKVRENLNSQWDCTHFHKTQLEEKKKFLKVFSDSLVRSSLFPADVLLMTHGGQLIPPSTLNFLLKVFLFLPSADFPLLSLLTFCDFFFLDILWFFFPYCCWSNIDRRSISIIVGHCQHVSHPACQVPSHSYRNKVYLQLSWSD